MKKVSFTENIVYNTDKPAIKVILETEVSKEIRIAMDSGQFMKEHKAPFPITVQVLEGVIEFGVQDENVLMNSGDLIALESNVLHDLKAKERSIIRLTLSKNDSASRIEKIIV